MAIVHCIFPFCQAEQTEPSHPASQAARQPARHRAAEPQETEQTEPTAPAQHRQHRQNPASPASVSLGPPGCQAAAESQSHLRDRQRSAESRRFWLSMAWPRVCLAFCHPLTGLAGALVSLAHALAQSLARASVGMYCPLDRFLALRCGLATPAH